MQTRIIGSKDRVPPNERWCAKHWETGELLCASNWDKMLGTFKRYNKERNLPIGLEFEKQVELAVCSNMPGQCEEVVGNKPARPHHLTSGDVVRGTRVLVSFGLSGAPFVAQEEANRRATICAACRYNMPYSKPCSGLCQQLTDVMNSTIGTRMTPRDSKLEACSICHCLNRVQIWFPLEHLAKGVTEDMRLAFREVPNCWKQC